MEQALEYLYELIAKGWDFADALYKAAESYGVDYYALRDVYDAGGI